MTFREKVSSTLVLIAFAAVFISLSVFAYTRKSATWDEPTHLARGYLGWHGDQRMDPEHPPFLRLWAALPLLTMKNISLETGMIEKISPADWVGIGQFQYAHYFLYKANDADRLLYRARFMIVLLGVVLGAMVFIWTREWLGFWPAIGALTLYSLEPNILAHGSLVTTDFGITCFMFGTVYYLWRTTRNLTAGNVIGLTIFFVLAIISKFSSLVLGPIVFLLLTIHVANRQPWGPARTRLAKAGISLGLIVLLALVSWGAVWVAYGFRYLPSASPTWVFHFSDDPSVVQRTPLIAHLVGWSDQHHLLPNAFSQGFLLGQAKAQVRSAYFLGELSTAGWWYYFPVAFAIKTPVVVLILLLISLVLVGVRWRKFLDTPVFVILPGAFYLAIAMTQTLNIGLRHILPIYPFVIVLCAVALAWILRHDREIITFCLATLIVVESVEFVRTYPNMLAFFNSFVGGPANGYKYLVDSNLDWGQDLKPLKRWMDKNDVTQINLAYFGTADPAYYGINEIPLPGAPFFEPTLDKPPVLPGYVAVSATVLSGVYAGTAERNFYEPLKQMEPVATIGNSINIYKIDQPWWR